MRNLKTFTLCVFLSFGISFIFSQSQYVGDFRFFSIGEKKITVEEINPSDYSVKTNEYCGSLIEQEPLSVFQCESGSNLYILQSDDIAIIYDENSNLLFWGAGKSKYRNTDLFLLGDKDYSSPSELFENGKKYLAENLGNISLDLPWCEAEQNDGIGISIDLGICGKGLLFSNGYVSEKMYLYNDNNRVKQIELTDKNDSSYHHIINLVDTAIPQYIKIDDRPGRHIVLKITDVYQGSKWNDTCINFILKIL